MKAQELKAAARRLGADLCGIADYTRFADLPAERNPLTLAPRTRTVVVLGHRILQGALRGVEEGTNFVSVYDHFGIAAPGWKYLTKTVAEVAAVIEDAGYEAVPVRAGHGSNDKVKLDYCELAHLAGLGSVGKGGFFLTPEYGQRQRFAMILTDMELEADDIIDLDFCKDCNACIEICPHGAFDADGKLDLNICRNCQNGVYPMRGAIASFIGAQGSDNMPDDPVDRHAALCGRTCVAALENKLSKTFCNRFRKRRVWRLDEDANFIEEK